MEIPIQDIIVKNRIRQNLGDLTGLCESIDRHGILNPIVINEKHELIAGHRRLESARKLGWAMVPVTILDGSDKADSLEMEIDENLYRKDFTADELADAYERLEKLRNPGLLRRIWNAIVTFFRKLFRRG